MTPSICKLSAKLSPLPRNNVATQPRPTSPRHFQALACRAIAARWPFRLASTMIGEPRGDGDVVAAMVGGLWDMLVSYSSQSRAPDTLGFQLSMWSPQRPGCRQQITRGPQWSHDRSHRRCQGTAWHSLRWLSGIIGSQWVWSGLPALQGSDRAARPEATAAEAQKLVRLQ
jgi:hypothetical protein